MNKYNLLRLIAAAIVALTATACASGVERSAPQQAPARLGGVVTTTEPGEPLGPISQEIMQDMNTATEVVNKYWATHWPEFFTDSYKPPTVVGLYDGKGAQVPSCGGKPLEANNAVYCIPEDYVAWDESLMALASKTGDAWVYLVIAHEWGHAIQARLSKTLTSRDSELQADCFAGAVLYGAGRDGTLQFEQGDEKEIANGLTLAADETPWTKGDDHGDPFQRIQAFGIGRTGGVNACLPMS